MRALRKVVADAGQVNRKGYSRRTGAHWAEGKFVEGVDCCAAFGPTMEAGCAVSAVCTVHLPNTYIHLSRNSIKLQQPPSRIASRICMAFCICRRGLNTYTFKLVIGNNDQS